MIYKYIYFLHMQHVSVALLYTFLQRPNKMKALLEMGNTCDFLCRCGVRAEGWACVCKTVCVYMSCQVVLVVYV